MSRTFLTAGAAAGTATSAVSGVVKNVDVVGIDGNRHVAVATEIWVVVLKHFLFSSLNWGNDSQFDYVILCRWVGSTTNYKLGVEFSVKLDTAWDDI